MDIRSRVGPLAALIVLVGAPGVAAIAAPAAMAPSATAAPQPAESNTASRLPLSVDDLPTPSEPWQLRLQRDACFGPCPVYGVVIHDDGSVDYSGQNNVGMAGGQQGKADAAALRALRKRLQRPAFGKLVGDYWFNSPACGHWTPDMAKVVFAVWSNGRWQLIKHDYGCGGAPRELYGLEEAIDKAARTSDFAAHRASS